MAVFDTVRETRNAVRRGLRNKQSWGAMDEALDRLYNAFWRKIDRDSRVCEPPEGFATEVIIVLAEQAGCLEEDQKAIGRILMAAARRNEREEKEKKAA